MKRDATTKGASGAAKSAKRTSPRTSPAPEADAGAALAEAQAETQAQAEARPAKGDPNLFVRPWVALWKHNDSSAAIDLEWEEDHPRIPGRTVKSSWKVSGHSTLGLPMPGDRRLFNVLCELTREQGMAQTVHFTRYDVLGRLGRSRGKQDYERRLQSFERLRAVSIVARNVFRDARTGVLEHAMFSIIDDVTIVKGGPSGGIQADELPLSTFSWSDRVFSNIRNSFPLTFDLNIAQSLHSDVALVLYPLLLAKTYDGPGHRGSFHLELRDFYENHLGMRATPYVSRMEERLRAGHEELKRVGFLLDAQIEPMKAKGRHKITYTLKAPEPPAESTPGAQGPGGVRHRVSAELRAGGAKERWQYPQPLWMEVLCGLLRDQPWKEEMECMRDGWPRGGRAAAEPRKRRARWKAGTRPRCRARRSARLCRRHRPISGGSRPPSAEQGTAGHEAGEQRQGVGKGEE